MKLRPINKLDKRNETTSKKLDNDVMLENCDDIVIFQFRTNLEQSGSRIPDAQSVKRMFILIVTFYLTKNENRI